jgi:uncharacterized protein (TIGR00255 family)
MTGFASLARETDMIVVSITARSVNHRYLDIQIRAPQVLQALESDVRGLIQQCLTRGHVDLTISVEFKRRPDVSVDVDDELMKALVDAANRPDVIDAVTGKWEVGDLLRFPQLVTVSESPRQVDEISHVEHEVARIVEEAVAAVDEMRLKEGEFLQSDLSERIVILGGLVENIEQSANKSDDSLRERLTQRVDELAPDLGADGAVVAQEVVRFVARSDIHEELTRLRAHMGHWGELVEDTAPCGRKLDFLLQEMNREVNTIGSKAMGAETSKLIVSAKSELEKLREQVQNVE